MDKQKVEMFLMANGKCFPQAALPAIQRQLEEMDESKWIMLQGISFRDPLDNVVSFIFRRRFGH